MHDMNITREQRQQAEEQANQVQLGLYAEPEAGEQLWSIATRFNMTERVTYRNFAIMVGDVVLGFYQQPALHALIQQTLPTLTPTQQLELEFEIKKFLLPLSAPDIPTPPADNLNSEIAETEQAMEELQGIRTMAGDMQAIQSSHPEPTYQSSSQSDLLRPTTPPPRNGPSWETDK